MYMPGRLRTASRPSSTWIALASYAGASARLGASRSESSGTRWSRSTGADPVVGASWGSCCGSGWGIDWATRGGLLVHAHGASARCALAGCHQSTRPGALGPRAPPGVEGACRPVSVVRRFGAGVVDPPHVRRASGAAHRPGADRPRAGETERPPSIHILWTDG